MNPLFRIRIRLQLVIIVLIVALPAAGIIISSGVQQRNQAINDAHIETQRLAERIASEQQILVASARQLVLSVSQLPEIKEKDAATVNPFLRKLLKLNTNIMILFIADNTGTIWASAIPFANPIKIDDRRYFKNALASGQLSSGEFQIDKFLHKPTFNLGYPYRNNSGEIIGVVAVEIDLDYYNVLLRRTLLPKGADIAIIDYKGLIQFRTTDPDKFIGKQLNPVLFKKMLEGPDADSNADTSIAFGNDGDLPQIKRFVSYQKLRLEGEQSPYMYVRVGIPAETALSEANEQIVKSMSLFALLLVSALFLAWFVGKRSIADRINLIKRASQNLTTGDIRIRVSDLVKGGELGELGESFDRMAEQLASRQRFLSTIIDTEPECVKLLDAEGRIEMMNSAGLKLMDAEYFEQVKGQSIYPLITTEYRNAFVKLSNDVFQGMSGNLELELVGFKERHVFLDTHVVPFRNDAGEIISLLGITRDITDRKLAEKSLIEKQRQLEELNIHLEQRVAEEVSDSRKKDQILLQQGRQAAMGEMISNIAHQWRQPLNTLGLIARNCR